jgi:Na+(H+)/acetate symporter ActP
VAPHSNRSPVAEAVILGLPSLVALVAGAAIGWFVDSGYFVDAVAAVALVLPVTLGSHTLTLFWQRRNPAGALLGMILGVILRALVIVAGGAGLFVGCQGEFQSRGLSLWVWVIGVYLSTLAVELSLLVRLRGGQGSTR